MQLPVKQHFCLCLQPNHIQASHFDEGFCRKIQLVGFKTIQVTTESFHYQPPNGISGSERILPNVERSTLSQLRVS